MESNDMTLDEAIAHCDEVAGACDTECRRKHKQLADWLRELKDRRRYQGGNAAAMHEALEALSAWAKDKTAIECAEFVGTTVAAALAAPVRNCDRFADLDEAIRTFAKECPNDKKQWVIDRYAMLVTWLFATAMKGDDDGSK